MTSDNGNSVHGEMAMRETATGEPDLLALEERAKADARRNTFRPPDAPAPAARPASANPEEAYSRAYWKEWERLEFMAGRYYLI